MFVVTVEFDPHPGQEGAFLAHVAAHARATLRAEPGSHRFDVCTDDAGLVFLYEVYEDEAAFAAHKTMPHYLAFATTTAPMVARKSVRTYRLDAPPTTSPPFALRIEADRPRHARPGGASTVQMVTPDSGARDLINGFTDIPPGAGIPLHWHNCEESVLVVSGRAVVQVGDDTCEAGATDVVWVPAGVPHRFSNPGPEPLRIFWTYASAEATRTLADTGETRRVAMEQGAK